MGDLISRNPILLFFLACFLGSLFLLGWLLLPFLSTLILGAVVSGIFYPIYRLIDQHPQIRSSLASLVTCILIFFALFVPIVFFVGSLTQQAFELYQMAKGAVINDQINSLLQETQVLEKANSILAKFNYELTGEEFKNAISEVAKFVGFYLYEQARAVASNTLAFLLSFFMMLMVIYFLLIDGEKLVSYIVDLSPLPSDQEWMLIDKFKGMAGAILIGNGFGGFIQGVLGGVVFWIFGLPSAFLWGVIMGLLAFLPIIGIGVVFIPTAVYLILKGKLAAGIFFVVFYLILSMGVEYVFKPKLVGQRVKMHPLLVFFAIIGGLKLFGIIGIIYGPLVVTGFLTLAEIYRSSYQTLVESGDG
ncbi:MAG: AI-2E family transporter [Desulfobacteraceae bacterium]